MLQLGGAVDAHGRVGALGLKVLEVEAPARVGVGGGGHDAPAAEAIAQQVGEQEGREMVQGKGLLEALGGVPAGAEQGPGVVGQDVDAGIARTDLVGQPAHLGHQREIGDVLVHRGSCAGPPELIGDGLHTPGLAAHERHLGAVLRQLDRGRAADAAGRAGEQDECHLRDSTERSNVRATGWRRL
jgi:hypothetical protein